MNVMMFTMLILKQSSRWSDEEKNYLASFLKKEIPEYPISNEYWKNCAHAMNADLGSNRTGEA